jgi:hypothetical protein
VADDAGDVEATDDDWGGVSGDEVEAATASMYLIDVVCPKQRVQLVFPTSGHVIINVRSEIDGGKTATPAKLQFDETGVCGPP